MNALPPKLSAFDQTLRLLIKAGLRENEADKFLGRLAGELSDGALKHEVERLKFIEHELARLEESQHRVPKGSGDLRAALIGVVSGVAANFLTDAIKTEIAGSKAVILPSLPLPSPRKSQSPADIIQIEWAEASLPAQAQAQIARLEPLLRHALQFHEQRNGTLDCGTAVYLDGLGMILDLQGSHHKAERVRRQAVKISQRVNGADHESTGAALSNFGLCLFAQKRYSESERYLAMGLRVLTACLGTNHPTTAGAVYNVYFCLHAHGRLTNVVMPQAFLDGLPKIRETATGLLALKIVVICLIALLDELRWLVNQLRIPNLKF